ncbi:hypothetical protein LOTGIDRAFT_217536 [Lottia gigantea]|uniref:L-fucokinase domain-containing protein n=1 Tax=Lottia gigantea TaxID=225164 RepID=V4A2S4_LOTGI|nr:hypothetical protein LOTGIDRAFT_217536 [Lottia gigantea]ESO90992.1 hypothetical protein LOTGIDRAFT_217536 [Lottia gigantea]
MGEAVKWTAIVVTCSNKSLTETLQQELEVHQAKGYLDQDAILLTVEDPKTDVGSGGATINALLTVTEFISARKGYSVINPDVLSDVYILILHVGRQYCYETLYRPLITLPVEYIAPEYDGLLTNLDFIIRVIGEKLAVKSGPGIWVSSTDLIISMPEHVDIPWKDCQVAAITVPVSLKMCKKHGVYKLDENGIVQNISYQKSADELGEYQRRDGTVPIVCGIIYLKREVAEKLLSFYFKPPLDGCCYMGLDSGQPPLQLSLFFDLLLPMSTEISEQDFVSGARSSSFGRPSSLVNEEAVNMRTARRLIWKELNGFRVQSCMIEEGTFNYLPELAVDHKRLLQDSPFKEYNFKNIEWKNVVHSYIKPTCNIHEESTIINSKITGKVKIDKKAVISHSSITGYVNIGRDSVLAGVNIDKIKVCYHIKLKTLSLKQHVITVHGRFDDIRTPSWKSTSTICNETWMLFLNRTGILREDLWGTEVENDDQTIYTAKLYPVFHATHSVGLEDILWLQGTLDDDDGKSILNRWRSSWRLSFKELIQFTDYGAELEWRKNLFYTVSEHEIEQAMLSQEHKGFYKVYNSASKEGFAQNILEKLDRMASETASPGVAARSLANVADILSCLAGKKGGLRSGPAANISWKKAFHLLENNDLIGGVAALAKERGKWLHRPDLLVRAARHYEGAAQILIRKAVMTAKEYIHLENIEQPAIGQWVRADCPARIDLAGGWSDTPPITYEHGGAVTMAALLINGKRPIGARVRRLAEPILKLNIVGNQGETMTVICSELSDMEGYCQPHSPGALLKAAFICADVIQLPSDLTLKEQLEKNYGGGFEIESWSNLPQGSGLGTSSILSGSVLAALLRAAGKTTTAESLIHAILYLEQLLTTGGGWQDQVGGLMGGFNYAHSPAKLPLEVLTEKLNVSPDTVASFNKRLALIYTGKTRLARNLLQDVIRNWYARNPYIVQTEDNLVVSAGKCKDALLKGEINVVGKILDEYWELKKRMAPGGEPELITKLIEELRPLIHGATLAGAGGGGFMFVLMREDNCQDLILKILSKKVCWIVFFYYNSLCRVYLWNIEMFKKCIPLELFYMLLCLRDKCQIFVLMLL